MRHNHEKKKLSTTLVVFTATILFAINLVVGVLTSVLAGNGLSNKQNLYLQQTTFSAQRQVEQFMEKYVIVAQVLSKNPQIESLIRNASKETPLISLPEMSQIQGMLQDTVDSYMNILGITLTSVEEDMLYYHDGRALNVSLSGRPYFQKAMAAKDLYISDPFVDVVTGDFCVAAMAQVKEGSRVVGFVMIDIKLKDISTFLSNMSFGETGRLVLLTQDNIVMGYENTSIVGKNFLEEGLSGDILEELDHPTGEVTHYTLQGERKLGVVFSLPQYGWKILAGLSVQEYNFDTYTVVFVLILLLILGAVIMISSIYYLIVKKLRPVSQIEDALCEINRGNLNTSLTITSNDEIGSISQSILSCQETLSSYVKEIDRLMSHLAKGDLTVWPTIQFEGDFTPIQRSIEQFIEKINALIGHISQSAESVGTGSQEVASGAQALAQGSTEQASSIQELSATIAQISSQIEANAQGSKDANETVLLADQALKESTANMDHLVGVMKQISEDSEKIHSIIKTIEDIAFQTNILALNAAVEAARAGQAGKGFAVVADEVGNLSSKSTEASAQIAQLIESTVRFIKAGDEATHNTKEAMARTVTHAMGVADKITQVSEASFQQAESIKSINLSMEQIASVVQNNSATAEQSAAASQELSAQATTLKELMSEFRFRPQV